MESEICYELFHCTQCGDCCNGYGGTYVSEENIRHIAAFIGKSVEDVKKYYCDRVGDKYMIGQKEDGYCVFFDKNCQIHPVKPKMCRAWPYLKSVLSEPSNWNIMAGSCPGMKPQANDKVVTRCVKDHIMAASEIS